MEQKDIFAQRLKIAMELRNVRAAELARQTGISPADISHYLKGDYAAKQNRVYEIARVLEVSKAWLMGVSDVMETSQIGFSKPEPVTIDLTMAYDVIRKRQKELFIQEGLEDEKANNLVALLDTLKKIPGDYYQEVQNYAKYIATTSQKESGNEDNQ